MVISIANGNRCMVISRSWVSSKELSNGWAMSGKYGPKENSVITCDKFIATEPVSIFFLHNTKIEPTVVVNVLMASITVPKSCNMQVR